MSTRVRVAAVALSGTLAALVAGGSGPASAATDGPCGPTDVTVVVDPGPLGGPVTTGCADDAPATAAALVEDAGYPLERAAGDTFFVCRVDGLPGAQDESCTRTPPTDAYWALFWSDGTEDWTYSSLGVDALEVEPGGLVAWRFQDGGAVDRPRFSPTRDDAPSEPTTAEVEPAGSGTEAAGGGDTGGGWLSVAALGAVVVLGGAGALAVRRRRG